MIRPKIAILCNFPAWLISQKVPLFHGHYAVWLKALYDSYPEDGPYKLHWVSLNKDISRPVRFSSREQHFHVLPRIKKTIGLMFKKNIDYALRIMDGYDFSSTLGRELTEKEKRVCSIDYYANHVGKNVIRTKSDVEFYKAHNGIEEIYTQKVQENIELNKDGYIETISSTIDHFENNATTPQTSTSRRTFTYSGDFCTGSTYNDENTQVTYKYNWSAHQLKNITILRENYKNNTVDYNTYKYTFDTKEFYRYSGTEVLPFVQSGIPQIFASMGYLGKCTPYILTDEVQGGYTKFGNVTSENTEVRNSYNFDGDVNNKLMYSGISNVYDTYSVTFSK